MTTKRQSNATAQKLTAIACATLGLMAALPAHAADSDEIAALKAELAAQRKLIEQLIANQAPGGGSPTNAGEVEEKLREQRRQPITAPETPPGQEVGETSFKMYGIADVSLSDYNSGYGSKLRVDGGGGMAASRLGAQITRNFSRTFKVTAVLEAGLQIGTGGVGAAPPALGINDTSPSSGGATGTGTQIFARQAWGGIDAGFGQISIGRQYTSSYIAAAAIGSAYGDGLYGTTGSFTPFIGGMPTRMNNSIAWATPKIADLYGLFTYTSGSDNNVGGATPVGSTSTNSKAGSGADLGVIYSSSVAQAALTAWSVRAASWVTDGETGLATKKGLQLAAKYDFGFVKVAADFVHGTISGGNYQHVTETLSDATGYGVSAVVPIGQRGHLMGSFTSVNDESPQNKDGKLYAIAYWYDLCKDTTLYSSFGKMKNNENASYSVYDGGNLVGNVARPGFSPDATEVGLNYRF